jgi:hypothetical protein
MNIEKLRKLAGREEIDYQFLLSALSDYTQPRNKITRWLQSGKLIRIKKGLYVFAKDEGLGIYCKELLANLIYGPSAISLRYALSFYGMIPERITTITSITNQRNKMFATPIGEFTYAYLHPSRFPISIDLVNPGEKNAFLIASKEKALCDHIHLTDRKIKLASIEDIGAYLFHDLRINENSLLTLRIKELTHIQGSYQDPRLDLLVKFTKKWKKDNA